jgi:hypothetical protein
MPDGKRGYLSIVLAIIVILAGAAVGGVFGSAASIMYDFPFHFPSEQQHKNPWGAHGLLLGAIGGAGAGLLWTILMRRVPAGAGGARIVFTGIGLGIAVGAMAAIVLHLGLMTFSGMWGSGPVEDGLIFGVPAGLVTGLFCGLAEWGCRRVERRAQEKAQAAEKP